MRAITASVCFVFLMAAFVWAGFHNASPEGKLSNAQSAYANCVAAKGFSSCKEEKKNLDAVVVEWENWLNAKK